MQKTAIRKVETKWTILGSLRCCDLQKQVADSIDFDKCLFVEKLDLQNPKEFFKILRSLRTTQNYPSTMYLGDESSSSAVGKQTFFNKFLGSVYSGKQCYQHFDTANIIVLSDIIFTTAQIKSQLRQNSLEMASKGIPSFVLHQSCDKTKEVWF